MRRPPGRGWKSWPCGCGRRRAGLAASLQRLEPAGGESDQKKREKYLAAANQGLYRLLRLADHLEFADARDQDLYRPAPLGHGGVLPGAVPGGGERVRHVGVPFFL